MDDELKEFLEEVDAASKELGTTYVDDGEKLVLASEFYKVVEPEWDDDDPEENTADYSDYEE